MRVSRVPPALGGGLKLFTQSLELLEVEFADHDASPCLARSDERRIHDELEHRALPKGVRHDFRFAAALRKTVARRDSWPVATRRCALGSRKCAMQASKSPRKRAVALGSSRSKRG